MQIEFSSSGGVTNQELSYQVNTENLTRLQADELERLVESQQAGHPMDERYYGASCAAPSAGAASAACPPEVDRIVCL